MRLRWLWAALIAIIAAAGGYWSWMQLQTQNKSAAVPSNLVTGPVRRASLRSVVSDTGPVVAASTQQARTEVAGSIVAISAKDGETVKAGQVLMELVSDTITANLEQARLDLRSAQAKLEEALQPSSSQIDQQVIRVQQSQLTVSTRQADVDALTVTAPITGVVTGVKAMVGDQINAGSVALSLYDDQDLRAEIQIPQSLTQDVQLKQPAEIYLQGLDKTVYGYTVEISSQAQGAGRDSLVPVSVLLPNIDGLRPGMTAMVTLKTERGAAIALAQGTVAARTRMDVKAKVAGTIKAVNVSEGARVQAGSTLVALESETLQRQLAQAQNDLKAAQLSLDSLRNIDTNTPTIEGLRLRVQQSQITLRSREQEAANLKVKAPADGTITGLSAKIGDKLAANAVICIINNYGALDVKVGVDELDLRKVKVGQEARVTLDALPRQQFQGRITDVAPEGATKDGVATFDVTIRLEQTTGIRAGMTAKVEIPIEQRENVLTVPAQSVTTTGNQSMVRKVLPDGRVESVPVKVGLNAGVQVEITDGLQEGDTIVYTTIAQQGGFRMPGLPGMGGPPGGPQPQMKIQTPQRPAGGTGGGGTRR